MSGVSRRGFISSVLALLGFGAKGLCEGRPDGGISFVLHADTQGFEDGLARAKRNLESWDEYVTRHANAARER